LLSCAQFAFALETINIFTFFLETSMAHVKSTAHPRDDATDAGGEGAAAERGAGSENRGSGCSAERTKSVQMSDVVSHSRIGPDADECSHMHNYHFGPSMVTISLIWEMIDNGYFADGMARAPGEETIPDSHADEAIVFEEFFSAGLRMPPHPVLSDILQKF
jgi:hypothetical protein